MKNNSTIQEMPEMMTQSEYVNAQTELDRISGVEHAGSLVRVGRLQAEHLRYVRAAVESRRDMHFENKYEYRDLVPGLRQYSINGNVAVFDGAKKTGKVTIEDIRFSMFLAAKRGWL